MDEELWGAFVLERAHTAVFPCGRPFVAATNGQQQQSICCLARHLARQALLAAHIRRSDCPLQDAYNECVHELERFRSQHKAGGMQHSVLLPCCIRCAADDPAETAM